MRLAQPTQAVSRTPEAQVVSYSLQAADARQRAAQRRVELEAAEREAERLEALAEREDRRRAQQAEAAQLEAQARELERGPIAQLRGRKAVALFGIRSAERRAAKIARSLEHQRESLTLTGDQLRSAARDGDSAALAGLTRHRDELQAVIAELEQGLLEARRDAALPREVIAEAERQLGGYLQGSPAFELQRLRKRAELLRSLDGEDEQAARLRLDEAFRIAHEAKSRELLAHEAQNRAVRAADERQQQAKAWRLGQPYLGRRN